jgi:3-oxoacyl-[acyl-carrier protein] reductase
MDLGIRGKKAIVCASSQGLGHTCALALAHEGCEVFINGRDANKLQRAAAALKHATGALVTAVQADLNTPAGSLTLLAACHTPDILVNNNAGPPPGELADWDHAAWTAALESDLLTAALLIRDTLPGMRCANWGVSSTSLRQWSSRRIPRCAFHRCARGFGSSVRGIGA